MQCPKGGATQWQDHPAPHPAEVLCTPQEPRTGRGPWGSTETATACPCASLTAAPTASPTAAPTAVHTVPEQLWGPAALPPPSLAATPVQLQQPLDSSLDLALRHITGLSPGFIPGLSPGPSPGLSAGVWPRGAARCRGVGRAGPGRSSGSSAAVFVVSSSPAPVPGAERTQTEPGSGEQRCLRDKPGEENTSIFVSLGLR